MKRLCAPFALLALALFSTAPAFAQSFVQDQAQMFSPATVAQLDGEIGNFNAQTGKEVLVVTVPSLNGANIATAAQQAAQQQNLNGVLVYISKGDRRYEIVPGSAEVRAGWFTSQTSAAIGQSMEAQFKAEDYDGGITAAVNGVLNVYRSHLASLPERGAAGGAVRHGYATSGTGVHISTFMWIFFIIIGFLIVRSILRANSYRNYGGSMMPPGQGGPPMGGPGYGGPGMGYGGYGYGGGGGSFWSGLLGGLGGAWLGNEMFGNRGGGMLGGGLDSGAAQAGGLDNGGGGWNNDMGQAGMGGASGGDWGGGGFGDMGGGGGFGGDSGGGW